MWTRFMASSTQAALHMGPSYENNFELFKYSEKESIKGLFRITRMVIEGNSEINNVFTADVASSFWENPCCLKNKQLSGQSKSFRLLGLRVMLGKMHGPEEAIKKWNDQVSTLKMCPTFREL